MTRFATMMIVTLVIAARSTALPLPNGPEIAITVETMGNQDFASVVIHADGSFVVAYESDGQDGFDDGVFVRSFLADGTPVANEAQVNLTTTGNQQDPSIARLANGSYVVVWDDGQPMTATRTIVGRLLDPTGMPMGVELAINEAMDTLDHNDAVVAAHGAGFVVAWERDAGGMLDEQVVARRFDADGTPLDTTFMVNTTDLDDQEDVAIGARADGGFVLIWESPNVDAELDGIVARVYGSDGTALTDEIRVNTFETGDQEDPALAVRPDGRFAVAWEDRAQDPGGDAVYARLFAADGTPLADPFQVDATDGLHRRPTIAFDGDRVVVAWDVNGAQDGSGIGVLVNRFDATGTADGDDVVVNTTFAGNQRAPWMVGNGFGRFVVVWVDEMNDGSGNGLFGQVLTNLPFVDGFESGDTSAWTTTVP